MHDSVSAARNIWQFCDGPIWISETLQVNGELQSEMIRDRIVVDFHDRKLSEMQRIVNFVVQGIMYQSLGNF